VFGRGPGSSLSRIAATGGEVDGATVMGPDQANQGRPHLLPDGRRFLLVATGTSEASGIYLGSLDDEEMTKLTTGTGSPDYSPAGSLLWIDNGRLLAQAFDLEQGRLSGQPVTLATAVGKVSAAAGGLVAYRLAAESRTEFEWFSRSGEPIGATGDPILGASVPRIAPDGRRLAFGREGELWIQDGRRLSQITYDGRNNSWPIWSSVDERIVFGSTRTGSLNIYVTQANASGVVEPLYPGEDVMLPTSRSPDGRFVLFFEPGELGGGLGIVPMDDERTPQLLPIPSGGGVHGVFSPDGHWIVFQSARSGAQQVWLTAFVPPDDQDAAVSGLWQVSTAGGIFPAWDADGDEIYYIRRHERRPTSRVAASARVRAVSTTSARTGASLSTSRSRARMRRSP
jgi:Tol biopolymer transport system component